MLNFEFKPVSLTQLIVEILKDEKWHTSISIANSLQTRTSDLARNWLRLRRQGYIRRALNPAGVGKLVHRDHVSKYCYQWTGKLWENSLTAHKHPTVRFWGAQRYRQQHNRAFSHDARDICS